MTKRFLVALLCLALVIPALAQSAPLQATDMAGRDIALDAPAAKVIALMPADCEILYAIGAGDTLIGRGEFCNYPEEVKALPAVQSGNELNLEQVIALAPQVVIMTKMAQKVEHAAALEKAGIKVVVSDAQNIQGVYQAIELLGKITGQGDTAAQLVASMKAEFDALKTQAQDKAAAKAYYEVSPLQYGLWAAGKNTFMDEIGAMIGLENIFADVDGWKEVSQEEVLKRNPDFIITTTMYMGEGAEPVDEIMARAGWDKLTAIAQKQVFNADADAITRPGPRLVDAAKALFEFVWGAVATDKAA